MASPSATPGDARPHNCLKCGAGTWSPDCPDTCWKCGADMCGKSCPTGCARCTEKQRAVA